MDRYGCIHAGEADWCINNGRCRERIRIDRDGQPDGMNVNAAQRYSPALGNLVLDAKFSLLRIRVLVIRLTAEQNTQRRNRSSMRDVDTELGQVCRSDAGSIARSRRGALNFALGKQGLEDRS